MQVKKFEASTMKDALEMVKLQLGPDAIILSAKDLRKGFGLMARDSVEVTAAVSELQSRKRELAEAKIPEQQRSQFRAKSARLQKQFIEKLAQARRGIPDAAEDYFDEAQEEQTSKDQTQYSGNLRYADIEDDEIPQYRRGFSGMPASVSPQVARAAQERLLQAQLKKSATPTKTAIPRASAQSASPARKTEAPGAHLNTDDYDFVENVEPTDYSSARVRSAVKSAFTASAAAFLGGEQPKGPAYMPNHAKAARGGSGYGLPKENISPSIAFAPESAAAPEPTEDVGALKEEIRQLQDFIKTLKAPTPTPLNGMTLHPGAENGLPYELSPIYEKMIASGISSNVMMNILGELRKTMDADQMKRKGLVEAWIAKYILDHTHTLAKPADGRIHIFIGPTGSGKTSALVKMASHLMIHDKRKVAILSADTFKVGAVDQLRIFAQILNVPFGLIRSRDEWDEMLNQLSGYDAILVDFPGTALRTLEDIDIFKSLLPAAHIPRRVHYVQSCSARDHDAFELARRYQLADFNDVIFTSLDEASTHGLIFNFQQQFQVPIHSFGLGRLIPEDFEWATRERVVDLIFKITKFRSAEARAIENDTYKEVGS